jgi:ATP synthase protein I
VSSAPSDGKRGGKGGGRADYSTLALASTATAELVAPILIGVWLDGRYGWAPWGMAVGATIGFVGSLAHLMRIAGRANRAAGGGEGDGE